MSFLSTKLVPSITGCIGKSIPIKQLEFPTLKSIMQIGWKTAAFRINIDGSYLSRSAAEVGGGAEYTTIWDDSGSAQTPILSPPFKMSDLNCENRLLYTWQAYIPFSYTSDNPNDPSGTALVSNYIAMDFSTAQTNGQTYWFLNSSAGLDIGTSNAPGRVIGECFVDGLKVSELYITPSFDDVQILRNYTLQFTTIQENLAE